MSEINPPRWARAFLRWYCKEEYLDEIEGDICELFYFKAKKSPRCAKIFFVWNVFRSFRLINLKKNQLINNWTVNLFTSYTKIYFRRFRKERTHYLVNIFGLSTGFAILFFILMYVQDERSIDGFHSKKDRIYRVINKSIEEDGLRSYISLLGLLQKH